MQLRFRVLQDFSWKAPAKLGASLYRLLAVSLKIADQANHVHRIHGTVSVRVATFVRTRSWTSSVEIAYQADYVSRADHLMAVGVTVDVVQVGHFRG